MIIFGHKRQRLYLKYLVKSGKIPHALLFCGPEKLGKKTIALEFIESICGKNVLDREHPDLFFIEPKEQEIQVDQIRNLCRQLSLKPYLSPFKIALINKAELLNKEAQNALLKTLEEPKGNAILILIASEPESLLLTIRSRCEAVKFSSIADSEIEKFLIDQKISSEKIKEIIDLSFGRSGLVIDFLQNPEKLEEQKKNKSELFKIIKGDLFLRFNRAKEISSVSENLKDVLDNWLFFLRSVLVSKIKGEDILEDCSILKIKDIIQKIQKMNFLISTTNVNKKLALETLLINI